MRGFVGKWITNTVALLAVIYMVPGIVADSGWTIMVAALVIGFLNVFVKPIMIVVSFPLLLFSLGIFLVVINGALLMLTGKLVAGFMVASWGSAIGGGILFSVFSTIFSFVTRQNKVVVKTRREKPVSKAAGVVIDVDAVDVDDKKKYIS